LWLGEAATPVPHHAGPCPEANTYCERLIGKIRRECVDFLIPLNEPSWCRITTRVAHTRVSARGFPTDHRVPRHDQPVIGFRAGIVSPPLRLSAVSITNTALSRT
jgi:hypothetical protein